MPRFIFPFGCILLLSCSSWAIAQNKPDQLKNNPFSQPDFLKYSPPVLNRVSPIESPQEVPEFSLTAIFISVNIPMAVVNDKLLTIGEEIDGIKLITVGEDNVKIRYANKTYTIPLKQLSAPASHTKIRRNVVK